MALASGWSCHSIEAMLCWCSSESCVGKITALIVPAMLQMTALKKLQASHELACTSVICAAQLKIPHIRCHWPARDQSSLDRAL